MNFGELKKSVESIEMPKDIQERIIRNCNSKMTQHKEEYTMKKNRTFKRPMAVAAAMSLCICLSTTAMAAANSGFFKDITNLVGAVTGTEYVQATDEINMSVAVGESELTVTATMVTPEVAPYSECEEFGIGSYQIVDAAGNVVVEGSVETLSEITADKAELKIELEGIESGIYQLKVTEFIGSKKGDQPLKISGLWECEFTI